MPDVTIEVIQLCGPICVDPDDGGRLCDLAAQGLGQGDCILFDFTGVSTLTSSFLSAAIGCLYGNFAADDLARRLKWRGLDATDESLMRLVQQNAIRFFSTAPEERDRLAEAGMQPFQNA